MRDLRGQREISSSHRPRRLPRPGDLQHRDHGGGDQEQRQEAEISRDRMVQPASGPDDAHDHGAGPEEGGEDPCGTAAAPRRRPAPGAPARVSVTAGRAGGTRACSRSRLRLPELHLRRRHVPQPPRRSPDVTGSKSPRRGIHPGSPLPGLRRRTCRRLRAGPGAVPVLGAMRPLPGRRRSGLEGLEGFSQFFPDDPPDMSSLRSGTPAPSASRPRRISSRSVTPEAAAESTRSARSAGRWTLVLL